MQEAIVIVGVGLAAAYVVYHIVDELFGNDDDDNLRPA